MICKRYGLFVLISFFFLFRSEAQTQDKLLVILNKELTRQWTEFQKVPLPPYYLEYRIDDINSHQITASYGSLLDSSPNKGRIGIVDVRLGDYIKDNTSNTQSNFNAVGGISLPLEGEEAIAQMLWLTADIKYKMSAYAFQGIGKSDKKDTESNFTKEESATYFEPEIAAEDLEIDIKAWESLAKKLSSKFSIDDAIVSNYVTFNYSINRRYFLNSEGSRIVQNFIRADLSISANIRDDAGNVIPQYKTYTAKYPKDLPDIDALLEDTDNMVEMLKKIKKAPYAQPYTGPAILSGRVAGVFFHEIFGHRIEGDRLSSISDGQTFKSKLKNDVLPKNISVSSNPQLSDFGGQFLTGFYNYDDQGIKGQRVILVDHGILNTFLLSRKPLMDFEKSNGHGRAQPGMFPMSRQSNLLVEVEGAKTMEKLRQQLIKECKKQSKEYGYLIDDVQGGYTTTDRYRPNAFNINPTIVYKIYVDGRPDELVKGVDLIGTPLTMFSEIAAAGTGSEVFAGYCGAESGQVPVTAIAPPLLIKNIETQKKPEQPVKLPILSSPEKKSIEQ